MTKHVRMSDGAVVDAHPSKMQELFEANRDISKEFNKQFAKTFRKINEIAGLSQTEIAKRTGLDKNTIGGWGLGATPSKKNIVKYAIRCKIDLLMIEILLRSGGYAFNFANEKEYAWAYLIMHYSGKTLEECDEVLKTIFNITDETAYLNE